MAIRQERVIALINSNLALWGAIRKAIQLTQDHTQYVRDGNMDAAAALSSLETHLNEQYLIPDYAAHITTISREYHHFKGSVHRNSRRAIRAEERRRAEGVQPLKHIHGLFETNSISQPPITIPRPRPSPSHSTSNEDKERRHAMQLEHEEMEARLAAGEYPESLRQLEEFIDDLDDRNASLDAAIRNRSNGGK